jgi:hypothetical protein
VVRRRRVRRRTRPPSGVTLMNREQARQAIFDGVGVSVPRHVRVIEGRHVIEGGGTISRHKVRGHEPRHSGSRPVASGGAARTPVRGRGGRTYADPPPDVRARPGQRERAQRRRTRRPSFGA